MREPKPGSENKQAAKGHKRKQIICNYYKAYINGSLYLDKLQSKSDRGVNSGSAYYVILTSHRFKS